MIEKYSGENLTRMFVNEKRLIKPGVICAIKKNELQALKSILKACSDE
jgi:hypothetical protein